MGWKSGIRGLCLGWWLFPQGQTKPHCQDVLKEERGHVT